MAFGPENIQAGQYYVHPSYPGTVYKGEPVYALYRDSSPYANQLRIVATNDKRFYNNVYCLKHETSAERGMWALFQPFVPPPAGISLMYCPFCGSHDVKYDNTANDVSPSIGVWDYVICDASKTGCGARSGYADCQVEAAYKWNNRK